MWHKTDLLCPRCAKNGKFHYLYEGKDTYFCTKFVACGFSVTKLAIHPNGD